MTSLGALYVLVPAAVFSAFSPSLLAGFFVCFLGQRRLGRRVGLGLLAFALAFVVLVAALAFTYLRLGVLDSHGGDEAAAMRILLLDYVIHSIMFYGVAAYLIVSAGLQLSGRAAAAFVLVIVALEVAYLVDVLSVSLRLHSPPWGLVRVGCYVVMLLVLAAGRKSPSIRRRFIC